MYSNHKTIITQKLQSIVLKLPIAIFKNCQLTLSYKNYVHPGHFLCFKNKKCNQARHLQILGCNFLPLYLFVIFFIISYKKYYLTAK